MLFRSSQTISEMSTSISNKISEIVNYYYLSTSATEQTGGEWSTTVPQWQDGKYIWRKDKIIYDDDNIEYTTPVNITGAKGDTGASGQDGVDGTDGVNGQSSYTHIKYSTNSNGVDFVDNPTDLTYYIGIAITTSSTSPTLNTDYSWSRYKGQDGQDGVDGQDGTDGQNGTDGNDGTSVSLVTTLYAKNTSNTTSPTDSDTWSTTIPTIQSTSEYI